MKSPRPGSAVLHGRCRRDGFRAMLDPMSRRYRRPDLVRRINAMAAACGGAAGVVPLDASELIDLAVSTTGLDDFGDFGDGDWRVRLEAVVRGINASDQHVVGRLM